MRIIIIGGSHAGIAIAKYLIKFDCHLDIILINDTSNLAFVPSTINFIFEGYSTIDNLTTDSIATKKTLEEMGINIKLNSPVTKIIPTTKTIQFLDNNLYQKELTYDRLILAMGSAKFSLSSFAPIQDNQQLLTYKSPAETIHAYQKIMASKEIAIVGAGLIGMELASSLTSVPNKKIEIFDQMNQPLFRYFDDNITHILLKKKPSCVTFTFGKTLHSTTKKDNKVCLSFFDQTKVRADVAIFATNPKPNIAIIPSPIMLDFDNTVMTNSYMQTSDPNIYAIGDLVKVPFSFKVKKAYLPLISIARKTALIAACHIAKLPIPSIKPVQRTIGTKIFDSYLGSTGITSAEASLLNLNVSSVTKSFTHYSSLPQYANFSLTLKIIFDTKSHLLLGAQLITNLHEALHLITLLAQAIVDEKTIEALLFHEQFYAPFLSADTDFISEIVLQALHSFSA